MKAMRAHQLAGAQLERPLAALFRQLDGLATDGLVGVGEGAKLRISSFHSRRASSAALTCAWLRVRGRISVGVTICALITINFGGGGGKTHSVQTWLRGLLGLGWAARSVTLCMDTASR